MNLRLPKPLLSPISWMSGPAIVRSSRLRVTMSCRKMPTLCKTTQATTYWQALPGSVRNPIAKQGNLLLRIPYVCSMSTRVRHKAVLYLSRYLSLSVVLHRVIRSCRDIFWSICYTLGYPTLIRISYTTE